MKIDKKNMLLYAVTGRNLGNGMTLYEQVELALKGGITCLQLRDKGVDEETTYKDALKIRDLCKEYNVPFIINDNLDLAIRCKADGVHLGQDDMSISKARELAGKDLIIGASAHNVAEALEAEKNGADYLGVGAVFPTSTKANVVKMENKILRDIVNAVSIPVVAIGGIGEDNILKLKGTGVDGVAVVSAIFGADDIEAACRRLSELSKAMISA